MESPFPNRPQRYVPRGVAARCIDHVTITAANPRGDAEWYRDTLGHRFMEYTVIPDRPDFPVFCMTTVCERSHDLGIVWDPTPVPGRINHFAYFVDSREELLRAADVFLNQDVAIEFGPGRHGMGEQDYLYVRDPSGMRVEINAGGYRNYEPDWEPRPLRAPAGLERLLQEPGDAAVDVRVLPARGGAARGRAERAGQDRPVRLMTAADETLAAGKAWLLARLEKGAHPLDGLDPDAARATIDSLTGLDPEPWTAAWGGLADDFAGTARAADRSGARSASSGSRPTGPRSWGATPCPTTRSRSASTTRASEFFLNATTLEDPPLEVVELPFEDSRLRFYLTRPATGETRPPVAMVWAGIDTWKEEMHVRLGALMRSRGFAVLLVDMPGVGESPVLADGDAERQWTPIFDWLADRDDLDGARCAAIGGSFGGYWAMKLAYTHRDRLALRSQLGRRRAHHVHAGVAGALAQRLLLPDGPDAGARADLRRRDLRGLRRPLPGALPARSGTPRPAVARRCSSSTAATTSRTQSTTST